MDVDENPQLTERNNSEDLFSSFSEDEKNSEGGLNEDEEMPIVKEDIPIERDSYSSWKGTPLEELQQNFGRWGPCPLPHVLASQNHTVLIKIPVKVGQVPEPFIASPQDKWDQDHVRMPNSSESLYPVQETEGEKGLRLRWELVQEALLCSILSSHQLEAAILSYNSRYNEKWNFVALHSFFNHVLNEEETEYFFRDVVPSMVRLALQLPELVTAPIPLLKKHKSHSITISQLQVASLLANAFFCTFPRRNSTKKGSEYSAYPDINFNRLFQCSDGDDDHSVVMEKLKCIISYFKRVCLSAPLGVLTFSRRHMLPASLPNWGKSRNLFPRMYISSEGHIEDEGSGMLQVDFANKYIGGGVLGWGCVQEEIRFLICPELLVSRLFTECLDSTEVLLIIGCERFSNYSGYGSSFKWTGEYHDKTPMDSSGRRHCSIVAMDALYFGNPSTQYSTQNLLREINKAYVGFHEPENPSGMPLSVVATGNWGCGAFRGDAKLKALLQLMAAAEAGRPLAYFTFGDHNLRDCIFRMYRYLVENKVSVGHLWNLLCRYSRLTSSANSVRPELYKYLYSAILEPLLPKEIPSQSICPEIPIQQSFKELLPKKPSNTSIKACAKMSKSTSEKKMNSNLTECRISAEDPDSIIEEFDSEPEEDQSQVLFKFEGIQQVRKSGQEQQLSEGPEPEDGDAGSTQHQDCKGKQQASKGAIKSMSCLNLIEESLRSCPSKPECSKDKKSLNEHCHPYISSRQLDDGKKTSDEINCSKGKQPVPKSARKSLSCLSLIEETLCHSKTLGSKETSTNEENNANLSAPVLSSSEKCLSNLSCDLTEPPTQEELTASYSLNVPESEVSSSTLNVISTCSGSKDSTDGNVGSVPVSRVDSPVRSSGTKRKISDYFNPIHS